jgi:hypothetical protein
MFDQILSAHRILFFDSDFDRQSARKNRRGRLEFSPGTIHFRSGKGKNRHFTIRRLSAGSLPMFKISHLLSLMYVDFSSVSESQINEAI